MIITVDIMYSSVDFEGNEQLREAIQTIMHTEMGVKVEGAFHSRAYKSGYWDGITDFYDMKEDRFHTGLLPQFLKGVRRLQESNPTLTYEIVDNRPNKLVDPESIDEEINVYSSDGGTITLRDYQYEAVKSAFEEKTGVLNLSTNSGKCQTKDTTLLTSEGLITIEEMFQGFDIPLDDRQREIKYTGNIELVNRYGDFEKPEYLTVNGIREVVRVKTKEGTILNNTKDHPLLTIDSNGEFKWVESSDLKQGDYLVTRVGDNVYGKNKYVSNEDAYRVGALVADGSYTIESRIVFTNDQKEIIDTVEEYFKSKNKLNIKKYRIEGNDTVDLRLYNTEATKKIHEEFQLDYVKSKDKEVPSIILKSDKQTQIEFLSGYLECEGYINGYRLSFEVTSASLKLLTQVRLMLKNIGLCPKLTEKVVKGYENNNYYKLVLGAKDTRELTNILNFRSSEKKDQVESFNQYYNKRQRNNKRDPVPFGKEIVSKYIKTLTKNKTEANRKYRVPKTISKDRIKRLIADFPNGDLKIKSTIESLASEMYMFEVVDEVEEVGYEPTYDVSMPKTNSFIANSVVNHNTITAIGFIQQILPYLKDNERVALFTHTRELFQQLSDNVKTSLGITDKELGTIGGGKFDIKGKQIVMVMIPTLNSALKDPKKGVKFTPKERVIKFIAEEVAPKFKKTVNTRELLRNYIKNCTLTTKVWESALEQLQYIAYDNQFTDKTAQMQLNKYIVEFDKIMEKKNKAKYKKYKETLDFLKSVRVMIPDESHHSKADTWFNNLSLCENADYRIGLTGTVDKKDEMGYQRLQALFTRVIAKVTNEQMIDQGVSSKPIIRVVPMVEPRDIEQVDNYLEAYRLGIVENDARNETIAKLAVGYKLRKPGGVLISVKEIDHGDRILEKLQDMNADVGFIHGNSDIEHRTNTLHKFAQGELDILIASTIIDEGVDMKSIGCMVLAAGGKSMRQQLQRIGRGLRLNGIDGNRVMVFDFEDKTNKFLLSHSKARKKIFKEEKFDVKNIGE